MKKFLSLGILSASILASAALAQPAKPAGYQVTPAAEQKLKPNAAGNYSQMILTQRANGISLITERAKTGDAEVHAAWNDDMFIQAGEVTMVLGGKLDNPHEVSSGETRGSGITGGKSFILHAGDYLFIPVNTPHRMILSPGKTIRYAVVKTHP